MVFDVQAGPGTVAIGAVLLIVGSIVALFTERVLDEFYRVRGKPAHEPQNWFVQATRGVSLLLAILGATLVQGTI